MAIRRLVQVDAETGEVIPGTPTLFAAKKRNGFGREFIQMSQLALIELGKEGGNIGNEALRVLLGLAGHCDFENSITISQSGLARKIGMTKQAVNRAVKKLVKFGFIEETKTETQARAFKLSPRIAWKGNGQAHILSIADHIKNSGPPQ